MRKLVLVTLLLIATTLLMAGDYFIGSGTSTENKVPTYGYNNYGWSKFFYTSDETVGAGMSGTVQITGIAFHVSNSVSNYVMDNQQIYMTHFYDSSYASSAVSYPNNAYYTLVYNGSVTFNGPGWVHVNFDTPFSYNSSFGFEILWENHDGSKVGGPPYFHYASQSYSSVYKTSDSSFPTVSGSRSSYHPNIWIQTPVTDVPPPAACVSPEDAATGLDVNASLVWNHMGGDPDHYRIWFGTDNPPSNIVNSEIVTDQYYTPTSYLDYATTYYWRVVPHNDFGYALDCPVWSFTTMDDPTIYTFPWAENFDGTFNPAGWADYAGGLVDPITLGADGSSQWMQDDWLNIASTDKAAKMNIWGTVSGWLVSPQLNISDDQYLVFDAALLKYGQPPTGTPPATNGTDDRFAVLIGDGFTWSTANILREWNNSGSPYVLNDISVYGTHVSIPLAGHSGRKRIAFFAGSTESNADNDFMLNNVEVKQMLETPSLNVGLDHSLNQLTLSWNAVPNATGYNIYKASAPDGEYILLNTVTATQYEVSAADAKAFFRIVAIN
jgi:hypothetical protein